jgi:predicted RNA-binding Zn ribbon-like protein
MVSRADAEGQLAPGELESVRTLLNTWLIPNDSRQPTDQFGMYAAGQGWSRARAAAVRRLRDDLRGAVETADPGRLNHWISELGLRPVIDGDRLAYQHDGSPAAEFLAAVIAAIAARTWRRLKACPDCHWVFYDNTRNGSKRWCLMYAGGPEGRACGTIAKVRRYRDRQAAAHTAG